MYRKQLVGLVSARIRASERARANELEIEGRKGVFLSLLSLFLSLSLLAQ
jgi:hypothetical protein